MNPASASSGKLRGPRCAWGKAKKSHSPRGVARVEGMEKPWLMIIPSIKIAIDLQAIVELMLIVRMNSSFFEIKLWQHLWKLWFCEMKVEWSQNLIDKHLENAKRRVLDVWFWTLILYSKFTWTHVHCFQGPTFVIVSVSHPAFHTDFGGFLKRGYP